MKLIKFLPLQLVINLNNYFLTKIIVIKLGTSSITSVSGVIETNTLERVAADISELHGLGHKIILVSSGAVGNGRGYLKNYRGRLMDRKAAAAVGNPILINKYSLAFSKHEITIAQALLERWHFSERKHFLQLRETIETLWENNIIPIANENDVVSDLEIKFSDNDHLATLLAAGFNADALLIGSSVEGILDDKGQVIPRISDVTSVVKEFVRDDKSALGLGGMATKVSYASLASKLGIKTTIFGLLTEKPIIGALENKIGTYFPPKATSPSARQMWLASGSLANGSLEVDEGAKNALLDRKSLLHVGVLAIITHFELGEIIDIKYNAQTIAVGISKVASKDIVLLNKESSTVVVHANNMVII